MRPLYSRGGASRNEVTDLDGAIGQHIKHAVGTTAFEFDASEVLDVLGVSSSHQDGERLLGRVRDDEWEADIVLVGVVEGCRDVSSVEDLDEWAVLGKVVNLFCNVVYWVDGVRLPAEGMPDPVALITLS
jgi:hypothetical protein